MHSLSNTNFDFRWLQKHFSDIEFFFIAIDFCDDPETKNYRLKAPDISCGIDSICHDGILCISSYSQEFKNGLARSADRGIVLFRGYELDQQVASYRNTPSEIQVDRLRNGVFCFIQVDKLEKTVRIRTDAFGISPVFYKYFNGMLLISSHNVLLRSENDQVDPIGELSMLNIGYAFGEHTVHSGIHRLPPGADCWIGPDDYKVKPWLDYSSLGSGNRLADENASQEIEKSFQTAMEKCIALAHKPICLPLSSGHDSRRIFSHLNQTKREFETVTARAYKVLRGEYYDIDGTFAPQLAKRFGISNYLVSAASPEQLTDDLSLRDMLLGSETLMHGWSFRLRAALTEISPSCIFDGLGGDALGNSGFVFSGFHQNYEQNPSILHRETSNSGISASLNIPKEVVEKYQSLYWDYLNDLPHNPNQCEIAFMLLRTRRSISPWILMTQSPKHLVFFPYLELGHVQKTLEFQPGEKYRMFFQKECLRRYYPSYFDVPGSRSMPSLLKPLPTAERMELAIRERHYLFSSNVEKTIKGRIGTINRNLFTINQAVWRHGSPRAWLFESLARYYRSEERNGYFVN
jgi:hypothetical protein